MVLHGKVPEGVLDSELEILCKNWCVSDDDKPGNTEEHFDAASQSGAGTL